MHGSIRVPVEYASRLRARCSCWCSADCRTSAAHHQLPAQRLRLQGDREREQGRRGKQAIEDPRNTEVVMKRFWRIKNSFDKSWLTANGQGPAALIGFVVFALSLSADAQFYNPPQSSGQPAGQKPAILNSVGLDQKLNTGLPLDAQFRDERGNVVALQQFFTGKPAILALVYYQCPMLCTEVLNGLASAIAPLKYDLGRDYQIITISIDPTETPAIAEAKKEKYVQHYARPGADQG